MRIGIVGAGMIGETLARRLGQLGHEVAIANSRGPETLRDIAAEQGATAVTALEARVAARSWSSPSPSGRCRTCPGTCLLESRRMSW